MNKNRIKFLKRVTPEDFESYYNDFNDMKGISVKATTIFQKEDDKIDAYIYYNEWVQEEIKAPVKTSQGGFNYI